MIFTAKNLPPETLEKAQSAYNSGITTISGIAKAAGITRVTVRRLFERAGTPTTPKSRPLAIGDSIYYDGQRVKITARHVALAARTGNDIEEQVARCVMADAYRAIGGVPVVRETRPYMSAEDAERCAREIEERSARYATGVYPARLAPPA